MEEKKIKREILQNTLTIFLIFLFIFLIFDIAIYKQVSNILYDEIDETINKTKQTLIDTLKSENGINKLLLGSDILKDRLNPRVIYILRDKDGNVLNEKNIGRIYNDYLEDQEFKTDSSTNIYMIKINNQYFFRGSTLKINNATSGETYYIQLLANVDGEAKTIKNLEKILIIGTSILIALVVIVSYELSRKTLKPIIESWQKQTEFVQNVSHELRTPLTIIQAKQEVLLQTPNSKIIDESEDINISLQETRRLTKMIKELMQLSLSDSNKDKLNKTLTNINDLIREISAPYIEFAEMQNKSIELDLNANKNVNIDREKISQLIIILLDNAIKYTEENDKITIKTYSKDKIFIEVSDTGIGISDDGMKHIFERFFREDKSRSRETGGTGLGLSIAYNIIKIHGGSIKVYKNEPKGTKFVIKL